MSINAMNSFLFLLLILLIVLFCIVTVNTKVPYFTLEDAWDAKETLNIPLTQFSIIDLWIGMNIELEHGSCDPETNVTFDDKYITAKVAWKHLKIDPKAYKIRNVDIKNKCKNRYVV